MPRTSINLWIRVTKSIRRNNFGGLAGRLAAVFIKRPGQVKNRYTETSGGKCRIICGGKYNQLHVSTMEYSSDIEIEF